MSFPSVVTPVHHVKLYSIKEPVQFRPYLVKEEKILLMAQQGGDVKEVDAAVRQIITACTFDKVNVNALPTFDLEMMMLQLRARSVNNLIELHYECQNPVPSTASETGTGPCGAPVEIAFNVDEVKLTAIDGHTNKIMLSDDLGVIMDYPNVDLMQELEAAESDPAKMITVIAKCLKMVFTKAGDTHEAKDEPVEAAEKFIGELQISQLAKIRAFFETMPRLTHTLKFECPTCKHSEDIVLSGLMDFFE